MILQYIMWCYIKIMLKKEAGVVQLRLIVSSICDKCLLINVNSFKGNHWLRLFLVNIAVTINPNCEQFGL